MWPRLWLYRSLGASRHLQWHLPIDSILNGFGCWFLLLLKMGWEMAFMRNGIDYITWSSDYTETYLGHWRLAGKDPWYPGRYRSSFQVAQFRRLADRVCKRQRVPRWQWICSVHSLAWRTSSKGATSANESKNKEFSINCIHNSLLKYSFLNC